MSQQPRIFISYRRRDEPDFVERMCDRFESRYGEENVFMDRKIPDFAHFEKHIIEEVDKSDVLVAVIGTQWLDLLKENSESDKPDFVVMEIELALDKGKMIAPICIKNAPVPKKECLPSGIRTRIQKMLDYQVSCVRGGSDFRDDMRKGIDSIDQRLEERGCKFGARTTDLDKFLDKSLEKLGNDVFELLEAGNVLRIEKYLRELPNYFLNKASEIEESQGDILKTFVDKIIVFGVVFIQHNRHIQPELYRKFLQTLQLVFKDAHEQFPSPHTKYADETLRIWTELLPKLYLLGAMLVQEDKYEWMSDFVKHPIPISWEHSSYYKGMFWMRYMPKNIRGIDQDAFLTCIINIGKENSYLYRQFSDGKEKIEDCICQFDFIQCVYDQISMGIDHTPYPFFAQCYRERTNPIIQRIIEDTQFRGMLFGGQLDDQKLAEIIRRLAHRASNMSGYWHGRWNDSFPREIMSFLEKNLPSDVFANSRYYL